MILVINVTQEDIDKGLENRGNSSKGKVYKCSIECPVAVALNRQTGREFSVTQEHVRDVKSDKTFPVNLWTQLRIFDSHGTMEPFSFQIEVAEGDLV